MKKSFQYILSMLIVTAVAGLGYVIEDYIGYRSVALMLLLTVSILSMLFSIKPVLYSTILSALIWDFLFIPPKFTFQVSYAEDFLLLIMYFVIALVNVVMTNRLRKIEKIANQKEEKERTIILYNTLLNSLSHELRTPISTIIGATDTLKSNSLELSSENKLTLINEVAKASLRLDRQVGNLLNMSRLQAGFVQPKKDWFDLNEFLQQLIRKVQHDFDEDESGKLRPIEIHGDSQLPLLKTDAGLLENALENLLMNALIYTPELAKVEIQFELLQAMKEHENTGIMYVANELLLRIKDTGPGFPPYEIKQVFDRFYRLKNSKTGGTGLGLSITKGFVEALGGTIKLTSTVGVGSEFTLHIPVEVYKVTKDKYEKFTNTDH